MKKIIIIITNILLSFTAVSGSIDEYLKLNTNKFDNLIRFESLEGSINAIEDTEQPKIIYTVVREKKAEEPKKEEPEKTEEPKQEIVKTDNNAKDKTDINKTEEKQEPEKEEVKTEEPKTEEPKQENIDPLAGVPSGNLISFNNLNKIGGVETLSIELQGYADQIMGYVYNSDEMTVSFDWGLDNQTFFTIEKAIGQTYFSYYNDGLIAYPVGDDYYFSIRNSKEKLQKSEEVERFIVNAVNSCVNSSMTEKEAVIAIHDYISNYLSYERSIYDTYDVITTKKGSCMAYAELFYLMCRQCGIQCEYIEGDTNQGYHAWNKVYISGIPYWVDVCWNATGKTSRYLLSSELWDNHFNPYCTSPLFWQRDGFYN